MSQPKSMRQICKVLILLAEHGDKTAEEVAEALCISEESVRGSLRQLCTKQKVIRTQINKHGKNSYSYNEEYDPPDRPKVVRCQSPVAKMMERKKPVAISNTYKYTAQKIILLRKLLNKVGDSDRDLLYGIIADYEVRKTG